MPDPRLVSSPSSSSTGALVAAEFVNFTILPFSVAGICSLKDLSQLKYTVRISPPGARHVWVMDRDNFDRLTQPRPIVRINGTYTPVPVDIYDDVSCSAVNLTTCKRDSGSASIEFAGKDHRLCLAVVNPGGRKSLNVTIDTSFNVDWARASAATSVRRHWGALPWYMQLASSLWSSAVALFAGWLLLAVYGT
ncbi:hypothetical protein THASP1DRAFT_32009 [Thamnocephalis sphaerospora]|uniref:Uncharacterized protein n=1 Tax=Thamnocephalis sphaerospora TaxID=78915 RepID=A0A4P9XK47_9FUNG|nr:hypothetical protein THASP1DRAFT_32009 [Thamnocephalis sphaerospora]|eukprot:RKP06167.1 hypothetical protein THASP1DRAFT_32009 [Thamnocephalis sphaerospora]